MNKLMLGQNLDFLLRREGLKQKDLSHRLCVSEATITEWKKGGSFPRLEPLLQILDIFKVSADSLFFSDLSSTPPPPKNRGIATSTAILKLPEIFLCGHLSAT